MRLLLLIPKDFFLNLNFHYSQIHVYDIEAAKKKVQISCKPVTQSSRSGVALHAFHKPSLGEVS